MPIDPVTGNIDILFSPFGGVVGRGSAGDRIVVWLRDVTLDPEQPGEQVTQNNARDALMQVNDRVEKVLYYEGEPRPEMKFVSRALEPDVNLKIGEDKNLQVVTLVSARIPYAMACDGVFFSRMARRTCRPIRPVRSRLSRPVPASSTTMTGADS